MYTNKIFMRGHKMRAVFAICLIAGTCLLIGNSTGFAQNEPMTPEAVAKTISEINQKMNQVILNQQKIQEALQEMREELDIVKIWARRG
jgi:hypothetical protein